jgi:hypothetical protein
MIPAVLWALVAAPACPSLAVEAVPDVQARWPRLAPAVREAFAARDDIDRCARVRLGATGSAIALEVALPDGRSASRSVAREEDVLPALAGLLLVPGPPPAAAPAPRVQVRANPVAPLADPREGTSVRIELSVATGGRIGDGHAGVGLAVLSAVEIGGWLAGFAGRMDGYQKIGGQDPTGALALAVFAGRRLRAGTVTLDVLPGAALALQRTVKSVKQAGSAEPGVTTSMFRADPRALLGARLSFRAASTLRPFLALEGECGRARGTADLPPLPAWTVGLWLGATLGTR